VFGHCQLRTLEKFTFLPSFRGSALPACHLNWGSLLKEPRFTAAAAAATTTATTVCYVVCTVVPCVWLHISVLSAVARSLRFLSLARHGVCHRRSPGTTAVCIWGVDVSVTDEASFLHSFRLPRMHAVHEMQPIVTDVCGVCPSVSLSVTRLNSASLCQNGQTDQDAVWGERCWRTLCYTGVLIPPQTGGGDLLLNFGTLLSPHISGTAEARDLKFCMHIEGDGPERKLCKSRSGRGHATHF